MRRRLVRRGKLYVQFVLWLIETMRRGVMRGRSGDLIVRGGGADGAWRVLWTWAVFCDLWAYVDSGCGVFRTIFTLLKIDFVWRETLL